MAPQDGSPRAALRFPRSFLGLLVTGFLLVAAPLVGALLYSAWHTQRLAEQSRSAVYNAAQAARGSRALVNRIGSIERLAQQVAVLPDPGLVEDYARLHQGFRQLTQDLARLPLDEEQLSALRRTINQEQVLYDLLAPDAQARPDASAVAERVADLAESANEVLAISYRVADGEVERLRVEAEGVQRTLLQLVLATLAAALAIAFALTRVIARPIAELDASIRQLGSADFAQPIRVGGPQDLRDLGSRLDWLRRRLTELEAQKNRFLRHLSHDLKTPLAALREGAELLNDQVAGPLAPPQRAVVSIMRDNSVKLQRLIEELLDYQRALHAAASLEVKSIALESLVEEAVKPHELAARAKSLRLAIEAEPAMVEADPEKLRSIVDNLVSNAVNFTPPGGTVTVSARAVAGEAIIEVLDTGPGVPQEERESIFNLFFRGRRSESATASGGRVKGTGLGLAIARELVEAHGGRIAVLGGEAGGHFRVTLPRRSARVLADAA